MIKSITIIILLFIAANTVFSQNTKSINFLDAVYEKPVSGVMVFSNGDFVSVSDINGNCHIDNHSNEIYCKYFGYNDTLVNIEDCEQCEIKLETNYTLLKEVEIDAKYNTKKHLLNLLKESQQTAYKLDTTIYYKFKEINKIPELGQIEIFTGILIVENKGYSKNWNLLFVSEISNYYNSIEQDNYELMQSSRLFEKFIIDILYPKSIKRLKKNYDVKRLDFSTKDSISFLLLYKDDNVTHEYNSVIFINNKIKTKEYAYIKSKGEQSTKSYNKTEYALSPISIPEHIDASREYFLTNNILVINHVEIEKIDNPKIEPDLKIYISNSSCKEIAEKAKSKFPDIIIPAELIEK